MNQDIEFLQGESQSLLEQLSADDKPKWGLMSAQHMIEHLGGIMILSTGRFEVPAMYEEEKLKRNYQYIIKGRKRFKRSTKAPLLPEEPLPLRFKDLDEARAKLKKGQTQFLAYYMENPEARNMHPAFGLLNFEEWAYFHAMHVQYHLDQFGLYEGGALED